MPGVKGVQSKREEEKKQNGRTQDGVLELWLRDGDQATLTILASGREDDLRLDDFYSHSVTYKNDDGSSGRKDVYCTKGTDDKCQYCAVNDRPNHRFAFWCYVYYILHNTKRDDEWKEETSATGDVKYREEVNSIRVFSRGFGRGDYIWNQVVDIFSETGDLRKQLIRLKRMGSEMQDTTYTFILGSKASKIPDDVAVKSKVLEPIKEFYKQKLSVESGSSKEEVVAPKVSTKEAEDEKVETAKRGRPRKVEDAAVVAKPVGGKPVVLDDDDFDEKEEDAEDPFVSGDDNKGVSTVEDDDELF